MRGRVLARRILNGLVDVMTGQSVLLRVFLNGLVFMVAGQSVCLLLLLVSNVSLGMGHKERLLLHAHVPRRRVCSSSEIEKSLAP